MSTTRQVRLRRRRRAGRIVLRVEVSEADVEATLTEAGLLSHMREPTRHELEAALSVLLARICSDTSRRAGR